MSFANSGLKLFSTSFNDEVLTPQSWPVGQYPTGENTPVTAPPQALQIVSIDIANRSGSTAAMGWGHRHPLSHLYVGNSTGTNFTSVKTALTAGSATLGTGGYVIVAGPQKFNSVGITISNKGSATSAGFKYWDGSTFQTITEITVLDPAFNAFKNNLFGIPSGWVPVASADTLNTAGIPIGWYAVRIALDATLVASTLSVSVLDDYVGNVADGNSLSKSFEGGQKFSLPPGCALIPYTSQANAANAVVIDFSQG